MNKTPFRNRYYLWLADLAIHYRKLVFTTIILLTLLSATTLPFLKIKTTRQGMHPADLPEQIRYQRFLDEFGTATQLVVLLQGESSNIKKAVDDVAAALVADPQWVRNVFYRIDLSFFEQNGLYFLPLEYLQKAQIYLQQDQNELTQLLTSPSMADALRTMEKLAGSANVDPTKAAEPLRAMEAALVQWERFLTDPTRTQIEFDGKMLKDFVPQSESDFLVKDGYLLSPDKRSAMMIVQQAKTTDDSSFIVPFMAYCRQTAAQRLVAHPGVTVGFTGWPVAVEEEVGMLKRDLAIVSFFSTIVILLLLYLSFRSITKSILIFVPLVFGVLWNTAFIYLVIGYLSYFTSVFIGLLFSLGTGYGIIFMRRFREEILKGFEPDEAMRQTFLSVGPGITTSAITTVSAFLAISLFDIPAFSQMGLVSATGMFCLMVATLLILPPLMLIFQKRIVTQAHIKVVGARAIDWTWRQIDRKPIVLILLGAILTACSLLLLPKLSFDYNVNNMLPVDSETLRVADRLENEMGQKTQFIAVMADNLDQARMLQDKLTALDTTAAVESPAQLVPADQEAKRQIMQALAEQIEKLPAPQVGQANIDELQKQLNAFSAKLGELQEAAFAEGKTELVGLLDKPITRLSAISQALSQPQGAQREAAFEQALVDLMQQTRVKTLTMLQAEPISLSSIPENLQRRFIGQSGKLAVMVFPKVEIWDPTFLNLFVEEVTGVAEEVFGQADGIERTTGFGVVYRKTSHLISFGFRKALFLSFGFVFVILLIDFRRLMPTLIAYLPLLIGMAFTLGVMIVMKRSLNMASQLALPVMVGIGIDFGVHTVHRWLEPDGHDPTVVVHTIGSTIWLAGATNMVGFGALMLARYRGLSSFGAILFFGILLAFVGAIFDIPAIIRVLRLDRRKNN